MASFKPKVNKTKLYESLGVPFHADLATVKSAYKRLALKWHPDRHVTARADEKEAAAAKFQVYTLVLILIYAVRVACTTFFVLFKSVYLSLDLRRQEIGFAFEVLSDEDKRAAYDAGGLPGVEAQGHEGDQCPSGPRSRQEQASADESLHAADQRRRREQAFATYRAVFGHNPVADLPRDGTGAASSGGLGVHNMAAQRGRGSFDVLQRKNLDDLFSDLGLDQKSMASSSTTTGKRGDAAYSAGSSSSSSRGSGGRAPTPDGWYH